MMNRPDYSEYTFEHVLIRDSVYIEDLDEYCDELEYKYNKALKDVIKLTKALDRACYELELSNKQLVDLDNRYIVFNKTLWKEWCMKDEE